MQDGIRGGKLHLTNMSKGKPYEKIDSIVIRGISPKTVVIRMGAIEFIIDRILE